MEPRGIRNNNPGNLERTTDPWQGLKKVQTDPRFFEFESAKWGIRALARTLITYQDKHGLNTVRKIISRWAPPNENDTRRYISVVCDRMAVSPDTVIDVHEYGCANPLVQAIIKHENGVQPYPQSVIDAGLVLAGIEPPAPEPLAKTATVKGSQIAAGATGLGLVAEVVREAEPALPLLQSLLEWAPWVVGALVLGGVAWILWDRIQDRRLGLR